MVLEKNPEKLPSVHNSVHIHTKDNSSTDASTPSPPVPKPLEPTAGPPGPGPPPNGDTKAWLQVLGAFFLTFNTWGLLNSFGVFQSIYASSLLKEESASNISWIGSAQAFLTLFGGVLCGRALDAGYFYVNVGGGAFCEVFGMMMTSLCHKYSQFMLAQGILVGIGSRMCFIPSVAIVGTYFSTRRATATGWAATGSCVGGIVYPVIIKQLTAEIGFRWATRVMGFIMLATLSVSITVMKPRLPPRKSGALINKELLRDPAFVCWLVAVFLTFIGLYIPFFYIISYAVSIGVNGNMAFYMLIIMNATSIPGRICPSMIADGTGNLAVIIPAVGFSGLIILCMQRAFTEGGLIAIAVFFGITSRSIQAVTPASVAYLCPDLSKLGTSIGMTLCAAGLGMHIGNPMAGVILAHQSKNGKQVYWGTLTFAGVLVLVGSGLLFCVRLIKVGFNQLVKA